MNKETKSQKRYWRPKESQGIEFLDAKLADCHFAPHIHNAFTVTVVEKGSLTLYYRTGQVVLHPGVLFIAGSQVPQGVNVSGQKDFCLYKSILMDEKCINLHFPEFFKEFRDSIVLFTSFEHSENVNNTINEIAKTSKSNLQPVFEHSERLFNQIDKGIVLEKSVISKEIQGIKDYIDHNYLYSFNINDLSHIACFSYSYLIKKFKHETGLSPYSYLIQRKIIRAKQLLLEGGSMLSIAQELGFFDQSHFSSTFKRVLGVSPRDYIENKKEG